MELVELVRHVVDYDPESGIFRWKNPKQGTRAKAGTIAGSVKQDGYVRLSLYGREVLAHRAAWMHFYGVEPSKMVDHINGNKSDNRIINLRLADLAENNWNRHNKTMITGANRSKNPKRHSKPWSALIRHRGKRFFLGWFYTEDEAKQAYQKAAKRLRGEFHEC